MTTSAPQYDAWGGLAYMEADIIGRPPRRRGRDGRWARADAGEWDWFYALSDQERAYIQRHHMAAEGQAPDQLAYTAGYDYVDEWADHWLGLVRQTMPQARKDWERIWDEASWDTDTMPPETGTLVGPTEIAELLSVKVDTVYQWVNRGRLPEPWDIVSGTRLWPRHVIEAWARETGRLIDPPAPEPF